MKVEEIEIPKEQIRKELKDLKKAIKEDFISRKDKITRDLLAVYGHLQHGGKIIDLHESFETTGLTKEDLPKLAIVPSGAKICYLYKISNGGAIFSRENKGWEATYRKREYDVKLPPETFGWEDLDHRRWKCLSPIVPPRINVQISARILPGYYHILFEAEGWEISKPARPPRDPILGKLLTPNLFGVLATWDLTPLERKIIRGRI